MLRIRRMPSAQPRREEAAQRLRWAEMKKTIRAERTPTGALQVVVTLARQSCEDGCFERLPVGECHARLLSQAGIQGMTCARAPMDAAGLAPLAQGQEQYGGAPVRERGFPHARPGIAMRREGTSLGREDFLTVP